MKPDSPDSPEAAAPATAPAQAVARSPAQPARAIPVLGLLALVCAVLALVLAGLLWQRLGVTQEELARRMQDSAVKIAESRTLASQAEAQSQELQARLAVVEVRLSEVTLQRSQLEELMLSLSRSRDDNLVQDLESALRLALQQAQVTGSAQPLLSALQAADQRIARAAQPRLNPVQRAIARDIERIQAASLADIPALAMQLDELARQVDQWPVLNQVGLRALEASSPASPAPPASAEVPSAAAAPTEASSWSRVSGWWSAFWQRLVSDAVRSGRELVRVSRIDRPEAALLAPEQAFFLRENVKLKLLNARLGLLARQLTTAQADVASVDASLGRYFDTRAPEVATAQAAVKRLRRDLVDSPLPRPDETLAALAAAAGGR